MGDFNIKRPVFTADPVQVFHDGGQIVQMFQHMMTGDFLKLIVVKRQRHDMKIVHHVRIVFGVNIERNGIRSRLTGTSDNKFIFRSFDHCHNFLICSAASLKRCGVPMSRNDLSVAYPQKPFPMIEGKKSLSSENFVAAGKSSFNSERKQ